MASGLVVACPTCAQKYRVSAERIGQHAHCKKCGQRFRIETDQPIDDDTILGWVMEDEEATDQSVLGSTSIFQPQRASKQLRPSISEWKSKPPPVKSRVRFDRIDDMGAYFEFPARELRYPDIRKSFPHKCIHCLGTVGLEVHLIIWGDKLPHKDEFHRRDVETKALGRLDQMLRQHHKRWFDRLEPMAVLPPPYCNPFPYFVCHNCSTVGEILSHVLPREGEEWCQIGIANLDIAREFFYNNGGKETSGYQELVETGARQRDDRWRRLAFPVRARISTWFKLDKGERFLGYFADSDFSRAETGSAGVVLTDRRMIFKKYSTRREFNVEAGGKLVIEADQRNAVVRIAQRNARDATLRSNPTTASHLARTLTNLKQPWHVNVATKNIAPRR